MTYQFRKFYFLIVFVIGILIISSLSCSNNSKSREIIKENDEIQNPYNSKSLLDILDSIDASIVIEQEIENSKESSFQEINVDEIEYKLVKNHRYDLKQSIKPPKIKIAGHWGNEIITGNFIGNRIDTIWLEEYEFDIDNITYPMYKTKSNIPNFPEIEMYWRGSGTAYIVNEGDLDGDGKEEWGWMIGNHQGNADLEYHLLHYNDKGYWEELVDEDGDPYDFSGEERHSGIDFFTKGPKKGTITISHYYWPEEPGSQREVKTIIDNPRWQKIY